LRIRPMRESLSLMFPTTLGSSTTGLVSRSCQLHGASEELPVGRDEEDDEEDHGLSGADTPHPPPPRRLNSAIVAGGGRNTDPPILTSLEKRLDSDPALYTARVQHLSAISP
jgi:hypothetical protein